MQLSIITPLYNRLELTREFVAALPGRLPAGLAWECLLVDDGSSDGTREWLSTLPPPFRALLNEGNQGFGRANNLGAREARGEILALLNNDLVLSPGWLPPLLASLRRSRTAQVGNVQRRVSDGTLDHAGIAVDAAGKIAHVRSLPRFAQGTREVFAVTAACCLVRRADFLDLGGFDESFENGGEDVDLALRLRARGRRTVVCFDSVVRHHVSASRGPTSERDERNSRRLYQRWHDVILREAALAWAREAVRPARLRGGQEALRTAAVCLPSVIGLAAEPPLLARMHAAHALLREELRWKKLFNESPGSGAPAAPGQYRCARFFSFDPVIDPEAVWLRDRATVELPADFPMSNFFLNGRVLPADPARLESAGPLGLRIRINGVQTAEVFPLPEDFFNFGVDAPAARPDRSTRVEVKLLGVGWTNFFAWLGRVIANWPLPRRWRDAAGAYRGQKLNRRLRISQVVADDEVIFDFKFQPALAPQLRKFRAPAGVNLIGWFRGELGIGESVRCMAKACDAIGLPTALVELKLNCLNENADSTFAARLQTANPYPVNIFHLDPPVAQDIDHHHGPAFRADHYNIAYWAWELPEFPDGWVSKHSYFDEIWCPSEFARAAIAAKLPKPVLTMPHAISFPVPQGDFRPKFGLPDHSFLFLFVYDLNSTQERKNPRAVIAAYRKAFPSGGSVALVIKTHNTDRNSDAFAELQAELAGLPNTHLICETLSRTAVYELLQVCDCFVSLHRAEGFGLSVAEAMFLGKPVIATDWSGTAEFVNAANGCPVNYSLVTLDRTHGPYSQGQTWADPDIDHAADWMQRLVDDSALRERLGAQAAADIRQRFSPEAIGSRYRRRLESFSLW
jgi:GT2 family glycosyltransferase/glycosyltransferase involved in cell wall biosynthesis